MIIFKPYKLTDPERIYYCYNTIMSYNLPIMLIIGDRGCGKTYGGYKWAYSRFKYTNEKFVILRDTDEAVAELTNNDGDKLFSAIKKDKKFKNDVFTLDKKNIYVNGKHAGYIMAASTFYKRKGSDYADITNIIYDEFIKETTQIRVGDDVWKFINSIQTLSRTRKCRLVLLGNALDKGDGILELLGFENIDKAGFYINKAKKAILHYSEPTPKFMKMKRESLTGLLVSGSRYEANIVGNKFAGNNDFIFDKKPKSDIIGIYVNKDGIAVRIYEDHKTGLYYATKDINPNTLLYMRYTFDINIVNTKIRLAPKEHQKFLKDIYANQLLYFESKFIKNNFLALIQ